MTEQSDLWTSVVASYDAQTLRELTNINSATSGGINTSFGEDAALEAINYFPIYAQLTYIATDSTHIAIGRRATIAILYKRGGTATELAIKEWSEVFDDDGLLAKLRRTGPRGRQGPTTNSGVTMRAENADGRNYNGWSDRDVSGIDFMGPRRIPAS